MKSGKEILEEKIDELEKIKKRCSEENYLPSGMLANYAMRDFLEWHIRDLKHILKVIEKTNS
jgi:hypothetical protein